MVFFSEWLASLKSWNKARRARRRQGQIESDFHRWKMCNMVAPATVKPNGMTVELACFADSLAQLKVLEGALLALQLSAWKHVSTLLIAPASLLAQRGDCWADAVDASSANARIGAMAADWACFCAAGAVPTPDALSWMAHALRRYPQASLVFGDAELDADAQPHLFAKPAPAMLFQIQSGYAGDVVLMRRDVVGKGADGLATSGRAFLYALVGMQFASALPNIVRVPRILACCAASFRYVDASLAALGQRLYASMGVPANLMLDATGSVFVRTPLTESAQAVYPKVSVIIPTRDRVDLLRVCIESLLRETDYPDLEVIVVDNGSTDPETLSYMSALSADGRALVIKDDKAFNYSRLNNAAAKVACGHYLLLLNNDIEVLDAGWLKLMVDVAKWSRVGCVGARLHYPSGELQHAGLVLGCGGGVAHVLRTARLEDGGAEQWARYTHEVSAVTGACLLISKKNYLSLGGLNERDLGVAFNDVDLCLRASEAGLQNVYVGEAGLCHHESISRGHDAQGGNVRRWRAEWAYLNHRWGKALQRDAHVSPHFSRYSDQFELSASVSKW
jgi:GT2 family glycosyltransferase